MLRVHRFEIGRCVGSDGSDGSSAFPTENIRELRWLVYTRAEVGVDVVDADELVLDQDLAFLGLWNRYISLVLQDFRSTGLLDVHGLHSLWE